MKTIARIWLVALIIQPIFFSFAFASIGGLIIIPFELIGSIPGIVVFGLSMQLLIRSGMSPVIKWCILITIAAATSFFTSYLVFYSIDHPLSRLGEEDLVMLSFAPASAILSIIINYKLVDSDLRNKSSKKDLSQSAIFHID